MQPTRRSTEAGEASGSVSPYLRSSCSNDYSTPTSNEQDRMGNFGTQQEPLTIKGNTFKVTFGTNSNISYNQENVTNTYVNSDPSPHTGETEDLENDSDEESIREIMQEYRSVLNSKIWDEEMDELLLQLGARFKCNWKRIAKKFNHKKITPNFIKTRHKELNAAVPSTRRIKFNHREDLMIAKYFEKFGSNWNQMAAFFPERTAIMLKNRYYSFIRKKDLIDLLLHKVQEIESSGDSVDDLKTSESERYTEFIDLKRETPKPLQQKVDGPLDMTQKRHLIFSYEGIKPAFLEDNSPDSIEAEKDSEIKLLKARVKSFQALYLQTMAELEKYKNKQ